MKTKCYSVRLESLISISDKAFKAISFDGNSDIIPKSQVFGQDYEVNKCEAYYMSAWILSKKSIQYSTKKERWFDNNTGRMLPKITITKHIPDKIAVKEINLNESLIR